MSFVVDGGVGKRPRFDTLAEANAVANEYMRKTRVVLGVYDDKRPATHVLQGSKQAVTGRKG